MENLAIVVHVGIISGRTASERWVHTTKVLGHTIAQNVRLTSLTLVLVGVERKGEKSFSGHLVAKSKATL